MFFNPNNVFKIKFDSKVMLKDLEISIILPCRNEESSIGFCLDEINRVVSENKLDAEIIIVNNNSTDGTCDVVRSMSGRLKNTRLVHHHDVGYGSAYLKGIEVSKGEFIFMADSDGSYDFNEIPRFIRGLKEGNDFVIGNRFAGHIDDGAMPFLHRYLGNPVLSGILRLFFGTKVRDSHCGMRAIKRVALDRLNLQTRGMEFASEMVVKACKKGLKIKEVSVNYHKRKGDSKLRSFVDGWRHLRFMLLYSPLFLFFVPGLFLFLLGAFLMGFVYFGVFEYFGINLGVVSMFTSSAMIVVGYQLMIFSFFAKTYAINHLGEPSSLDRIYKYFTIEKTIFAGAIGFLIGFVIFVKVFVDFGLGSFSLIDAKNSVISLTLIMIGVQSIFSSFMLSVLGIKEK